MKSVQAARDINQQTRCSPYIKDDPNEPGKFNKGEDWTYYDKMNISIDPSTGSLKTDSYVVDVAQKTFFLAYREKTYQYKVDVTADAKKGGHFTSRVELLSSKGLGQQFTIVLLNSSDSVLAHVWTMPQENCISDQNFDASEVASIQFYTRRFDR